MGQFKKTVLSLSVDGVSEQGEYLRFPAKWPVVEQTSKEWLNRARTDSNWDVNLCATVSAFSLFGLANLEAWWNEIAQGKDMILQPVFHPDYMSPEVFPAEFVRRHIDRVPKAVQGLFSSKAKPQTLKRFFAYNLALDKIRGESMFTVFPELVELNSTADGTDQNLTV
jgi:hypothetical protein